MNKIIEVTHLFGRENYYILIFCLFKVDAIECFQCDSSNSECVNLTKSDTNSLFLKPCMVNNGTAFCRKTIQTSKYL